MIRYREFSISAASLAGMTLATGCDGSVGSIEGDWTASLLIAGSATYEMPFNFTGGFEYTDSWGYTYAWDFTEWTKDMTLSVDEEGGASLSDETSQVYSLTITYGTYEPSVYDVETSTHSHFDGSVVKTGDRTFDIFGTLSNSERTLIVNGEDQLVDVVESEDPRDQGGISARCGTDGDTMTCDLGGSFVVFTANE